MTILSQLAEGGQTFAHRIRMLRQVLKIAIWSATAIATTAIIFLMLRIEPRLYQGAWYHAKARIHAELDGEMLVDPQIWWRLTGRSVTSPPGVVPTDSAIVLTAPYAEQFLSIASHQLVVSGLTWCISLLGVLMFFTFRGTLSGRKEHISGGRKSSSSSLAMKLSLARKASDLRLGELPFVKGTETQHTLITGGTGSGKTNCLHHLLPQIRKRGDKLVLLDPTGELAVRYYKDGDVILNPLDDRAASWHPWVECAEPADVDNLAESLIPTSHSDRELYWRTAARALFSSVMNNLALEQTNPKTSQLAHWLLRAPLSDLCRYLEGTPAVAFLDINSEKTAASVRSVAASFLKCLEHLPDTSTPFSVSEWVGAKDDGWLFLHCTPPQRAAVGPLLTNWFSLAARGLLRLPSDLDRRVWFVVEELPSMNRIRDLELLLAEGRKYGACSVLSLQSPAQLEAIYGRQGAQTILGNCSTRIVFSERDPEIADRISKIFGQQEVREYQEGISYGAHQMRDGVSLSKVTKMRPVISSTDIQSLYPHHAYVRLPGNYPVAQIKLTIKRPSIVTRNNIAKSKRTC